MRAPRERPEPASPWPSRSAAGIDSASVQRVRGLLDVVRVRAQHRVVELVVRAGLGREAHHAVAPVEQRTLLGDEIEPVLDRVDEQHVVAAERRRRCGRSRRARRARPAASRRSPSVVDPLDGLRRPPGGTPRYSASASRDGFSIATNTTRSRHSGCASSRRSKARNPRTMFFDGSMRSMRSEQRGRRRARRARPRPRWRRRSRRRRGATARPGPRGAANAPANGASGPRTVRTHACVRVAPSAPCGSRRARRPSTSTDRDRDVVGQDADRSRPAERRVREVRDRGGRGGSRGACPGTRRAGSPARARRRRRPRLGPPVGERSVDLDERRPTRRGSAGRSGAAREVEQAVVQEPQRSRWRHVVVQAVRARGRASSSSSVDPVDRASHRPGPRRGRRR